MITAQVEKQAEVDERRRAERFHVELGATVREMGSEGSDARVINISETGFMAETDLDLIVGSRIWLLLPGQDRASAMVRWTAGNRVGAQFVEPIRVEELTA